MNVQRALWTAALLGCLAAAASAQSASTRTADRPTSYTRAVGKYDVNTKKQSGKSFRMPIPAVGQPAPDLVFRDEEGKLRGLGDLKGKVVALIWLMPEAANNKRLLLAGRVQALSALSPDQAAVVHVKERLTTHTFEWPAPEHPPIMVADPRYFNAMRFGINKLPTAVILDRDGTIAYRGALDNDPLGTLPDAERIDYAADALRSVVNGQAVTTASTALHGDPLLYMPIQRDAKARQGNVIRRQKSKSP